MSEMLSFTNNGCNMTNAMPIISSARKTLQTVFLPLDAARMRSKGISKNFVLFKTLAPFLLIFIIGKDKPIADTVYES